MDSTLRACPQCGAAIPADPGPTWCDRCDWNLKAPERSAPTRLFDRLSVRMSSRAADRLFEQVLAEMPSERRVTAREVLTVVVALLVHLVAIATFALGIALVVWTWPGPGIVLGGLAVLFAMALRPRLGRMPRHAVARTELPELAAFVDRIGEHVGASPVDAFALDPNMNASFSRVGVRRRSVVVIGMPFWCAASPDERVAFVAHELAHSVNGDPARTFVVGSAMAALDRWYDILTQQHMFVRGRRNVLAAEVRLAERLVTPLFWVLRTVPLSVAFVLNQLRWSTSQRAEYLADIMGARASGSAAALTTFELDYLLDSFLFIVERSRTYERDRNPIDAFAARVACRTPREIERIRRIERLPGSAVDRTHPATWRRIAVIEKLDATRGVVIEPEVHARIDAERAPYKQACARALQGL